MSDLINQFLTKLLIYVFGFMAFQTANLLIFILRQEAEVSRNQLIIHWERQVELLEQKLRLRDKEKMELSSRERQASVIIQQMKQTLNEKELMIERIKRDKPEGECSLGFNSFQ